MLRRWAIITALAVLLAAVVRLQMIRERLEPAAVPAAQAAGILYLRSPAAAKRVALSYDAAVADLYWIRAIQHYGRTKLSTDPDKSYDLLYPLLDLTASLDPRFTIAYRFGSVFLSEPFPSGPGRPDLAIRLLEKGLAADARWEYAYDIGFVHYWWLQDYERAAEWFLRASTMPRAPSWLKPLAAVVTTEGGSRESARQIWGQILETAEVEWLRRSAEIRMRQLDAMDHIDVLTRIARDYEMKFGEPVRTWQQLLRAGYIRRLPVDPEYHQYQMDPQTGAITLWPASPLNPLPTQPLRATPLDFGR